MICDPTVVVYGTEGSITTNFEAGLEARRKMLLKEYGLLKEGSFGRRRFLMSLAIREAANMEMRSAFLSLRRSLFGREMVSS